MRELIAEQFDAETPELLSGEVEVDESYLGVTERAGAGGALARQGPNVRAPEAGREAHAVDIPNA